MTEVHYAPGALQVHPSCSILTHYNSDTRREFINNMANRGSQDDHFTSSSPLFHERLSLNHRFKCPFAVCSYITNHRSNLRRHVSAMHESIKTSMKCCEQKFYTRLQYRLHMNTVHSKGYYCQLCKQFFARRNILSRHLDAVHGSLPHAHQCPKCSYSSSHKSNLKRHMFVKHFDGEFFKCKNSNPRENIWRPVPELFSLEKNQSKKASPTGKANISLHHGQTQLQQVEEPNPSEPSQVIGYKTMELLPTLLSGAEETAMVNTGTKNLAEELKTKDVSVTNVDKDRLVETDSKMEGLTTKSLPCSTKVTQEIFSQANSHQSYLPKKLRVSRRYSGMNTLFN